MSKRTKVLILSMLTVMCCIAVIAVGTYALFTDQVTMNNHLEAGTLNATLKRTYLKWTKLDVDGYLTSDDSETVIDFTDNTTDNVFGINANELVVPGSTYEATMELTNNSDVAFGYWIEVVITEGRDSALAKQLRVEVATESETKTSTLNNNLIVGSENDFVAKVSADEGATKSTFKVKVYFMDDANSNDNPTGNGFVNNDAMGKEVKFDLVVKAVQITTAD